MYTIGKLARKTRIKTDSIRFYERQGLLAPEAKTRSGYRLYSDAAVRRLLVIKNAQRCGFTLDEIGTLLRLPDATNGSSRVAYRMLAEKKHEIDKTIDTLRAMSGALAALLTARDSDDPAREMTSPENIVLNALDSLGTSRPAHLPLSSSGIAAVRLPLG
jgi:MerR family Zn(II)-responsive transcriptional regulator of zntA